MEGKMAKLKLIHFNPNLAHVLGFRHGPRAANPPAGNVWDYWRMVSPKAPEIAERTVKTYFPDLVPAALRCSQIPRSAQTLGLLWPNLVPKVKLDRRLAFEFENLKQWAPIDAYSNAYDMTPQEQHSIQPDLVDQCGINFFEAATSLAHAVGIGRVGAMCSHVPYADAGARHARKILGITEGDGWLPGNGFGSGAFVHLAFKSLEPHPSDEFDLRHRHYLVSCDYYPVPEV